MNKPAGIFVHETNLKKSELSLRDVILQCRRYAFLAPVHRLDKPTTGVLIFAKTHDAASSLGIQMQDSVNHSVKKRYICAVRGKLRTGLRLDYSLPQVHPKTSPAPKQNAVTSLTPLEILMFPVAFGKYPEFAVTLVEAMPHTGRTHQIRRHLKHLSHPILGDTVYGNGSANRLAREILGVPGLLLHAQSISLRHPGSEREVVFTAENPSWVSNLLKAGKNES